MLNVNNRMSLSTQEVSYERDCNVWFRVRIIINQLIYLQNSLHRTNAMFGMIYVRFWPGLYTRANTESYKELGNKTEGFRKANILQY